MIQCEKAGLSVILLINNSLQLCCTLVIGWLGGI